METKLNTRFYHYSDVKEQLLVAFCLPEKLVFPSTGATYDCNIVFDFVNNQFKLIFCFSACFAARLLTQFDCLTC